MSVFFDLSIPISHKRPLPAAFSLSHPNINTICSTDSGASVNCSLWNNVCVHGCTTHTECIAHITSLPITMLDLINKIPIWMPAILISVPTRKIMDASEEEQSELLSHDDVFQTSDQIVSVLDVEPIFLAILQQHGSPVSLEACIIRTLPNDDSKLSRVYSGENPPFLSPSTTRFLTSRNICHVLVDLPSVDKEKDGGLLMAHKTILNVPYSTGNGKDSLNEDIWIEDVLDAKVRTISELCFIPNEVNDGIYNLNLQMTAWEADAVPSRPVIVPLK